MNDADLRATIEGDVLGVVSAHGGKLIIAGPSMYQLVQELTDLVLKWRARAVMLGAVAKGDEAAHG